MKKNKLMEVTVPSRSLRHHGALFQNCVVGHFCEKGIGSFLFVQAADDVAEAVADDKPLHAQYHIITPHLVEDLLGQRHRRSLVLDDHARLAVHAIENRVAAPRHAVQRQRHLVAQQAGRVVLVVDEKRREMLPHPLLGGQPHTPPAQRVEHRSGALGVFDAQLCCRQLQGRVGDSFLVFHAAKVEKSLKFKV